MSAPITPQTEEKQSLEIQVVLVSADTVDSVSTANDSIQRE